MYLFHTLSFILSLPFNLFLFPLFFILWQLYFYIFEMRKNSKIFYESPFQSFQV